MTATVPILPRRVSPTTRAIIESQAALAAAYPLDETNPHMDVAVRQVGIALMAEVGHSLDPHEVHDCFMSLVDMVQRLQDFDADPDGFLAAVPRPQTVEQRDIVRGALLADRVHWLQRLLDLS